MTKLSKTKRAAMIMLPCLLCAAMASCAAIPSFIRSIPPPLEETEPWAHAISQAEESGAARGRAFRSPAQTGAAAGRKAQYAHVQQKLQKHVDGGVLASGKAEMAPNGPPERLHRS